MLEAPRAAALRAGATRLAAGAQRSRCAAVPHRPRRCAAQRAAAPRGVARRCVLVCSAGEGSTTTSEPLAGGASALDAAAATVAVLRQELPFLARQDVVSENVKYSFLAPLVEVSGRAEYLKAHAHWRSELPRRLGDGWKWEVLRVFQPEPRTMVVRWRMKWVPRPLGFSQWPTQLDDAEAPPVSASGLAPAQASDADEEVSVSVTRLAQRLEAAETALVRAIGELDGTAAPASATATLSDALRDLRAGLEQSKALAAEVQAAEAAEAAQLAATPGWLTALVGTPEEQEARNAEFAAELAELREELTSSVTGTTTLVLDAAGLVVSHVDALDFDGVLAGASLAAKVDSRRADAQEAQADGTPARNRGADAAASASSAAATAAEERAMRASASTAEAIYALAIAMRLPGRGAWGWRLDVLRQLLWEGFTRDDEMDDEVRVSLTREDFDEIVTLTVGSVAFFAVVSTTYLSYWLVFIAPDLPAQLAQLAPAVGAPASVAAATAPSFDWLAALSGALQPSLFR